MTESKLTNLPPEPLAPIDDLPVVARLVVEIRSDGTRTVARGAIEDRLGGENVSIHAEGTTPAALALSLLSSLQKLPVFHSVNAAKMLAQQLWKALLPGGRR